MQYEVAGGRKLRTAASIIDVSYSHFLTVFFSSILLLLAC